MTEQDIILLKEFIADSKEQLEKNPENANSLADQIDESERKLEEAKKSTSHNNTVSFRAH